jgi:hypothetical protein
LVGVGLSLAWVDFTVVLCSVGGSGVVCSGVSAAQLGFFQSSRDYLGRPFLSFESTVGVGSPGQL